MKPFVMDEPIEILERMAKEREKTILHEVSVIMACAAPL